MKHIKDLGIFLKYLTTRPLKMAWLLAIKIVLALGCWYISSDIDGLNVNNPMLWFVIILVFFAVIDYLAMYHPYLEWRAKIEEEERQQVIRDNFAKNNKNR